MKDVCMTRPAITAFRVSVLCIALSAVPFAVKGDPARYTTGDGTGYEISFSTFESSTVSMSVASDYVLLSVIEPVASSSSTQNGEYVLQDGFVPALNLYIFSNGFE
jgi:hypothetical protein